ncbi:hypothetical protein BTUL_0151g00240 [Botrytis tulipae]|uniref:Rhodopsin domain-containing protein n=1 Tax=Botrytis tulipae TaxID=87230 RepID=A0A4Z1EGK7_9HELO|nr:hypothetical protein BTUL_0151g00240 [Botrytis tulipae]
MSANELAISFVGPGEVTAAGVALPVVGITVVALRFWLRGYQKAKLGLDDYTILAALLFVIGMGICLVYGVAKRSLGYPTPQLPNATPESQLTQIVPAQTLVELLDWIIWLLMIPANGLIKLSAIFLYRRLFVVNKGTTFDIITKAFIVICSLWTVAFWFATIFGCGTHFTNPWKPLIFIMECNTNMRLDGLMISDLITDIMVWLLPMPVVWRLNMRWSQKLYITGVFFLAAGSLVAAIVRLMVQLEISNGGYAAHTDVDLTLTILLYYSGLESGLALIAACLPTLHYFIARPPVQNLLSSVGSLLGLDSLRSRFTSSSQSNENTAPDTEILVTKKVSQSSHSGGSFVASERDVHVYKLSHIEDGIELPLVPTPPGRMHTRISGRA